VRYPKGLAAAVFWPDVAGIPVQGRHLCYRWNGDRADAYFVYGQEEWIPLRGPGNDGGGARSPP
jgi:hypothetical protein